MSRTLVELKNLLQKAKKAAEVLYDIDARVGITLLNGWLEWLQQPYKEDE